MGRLVHQIYIRDGVDDEGTPGNVAFAELFDPRREDVLRKNLTNLIHVRVFNRGPQPTMVEVELWWAEATVPLVASPPDPNAPPFEHGKWRRLPPKPGTADTATPTIPPGDWGFARFTWDPPLPDPEPDPSAAKPCRAMILVALVRTHSGSPPDPTVEEDPLPVKEQVQDLETFWDFFRDLRRSDNATLRAIRYDL